MSLIFDSIRAEREKTRIIENICSVVENDGKVVIGLSGGLDSDVVARLSVFALGKNRVKLFTVLQEGMEEEHVQNAYNTAKDVEVPLHVIDLKDIPFAFISALAVADPSESFQPNGLLDPGRAKCSLRTAIFSTYQDRGFVVFGSSNRTEIETGFFLPFGDGIWHFGPIAHLYKSQVIEIARCCGTHQDVIKQPPSAGFWPGQEDLQDLAYWLYNNGPIGYQRNFNEDDDLEVEKIRELLSIQAIDKTLFAFANGEDNDTACITGKLPLNIVTRLRNLCDRARITKRREIGVKIIP